MQKQKSRKRHSDKEIARKLGRAERLASEGKTHSEIADALGITTMTYHRWRKNRSAIPAHNPSSRPRNGARRNGKGKGKLQRNGIEDVHQLKADNALLRDLLVRMILEREQSRIIDLKRL